MCKTLLIQNPCYVHTVLSRSSLPDLSMSKRDTTSPVLFYLFFFFSLNRLSEDLLFQKLFSLLRNYYAYNSIQIIKILHLNYDVHSVWAWLSAASIIWCTNLYYTVHLNTRYLYTSVCVCKH